MTELFCKNCKAPLSADKVSDGVLECEYCHSVFTMPKKETDEKALGFLRIGEHETDMGRFDAAYEAYRKATQYDSAEPEAYYGMALAEFRVQYVRDEVNERLQPICHAVTDKVFTKNANYIKALSLASPSQRAQYVLRGGEIDRISEEFARLRKSGLDYDCFICAKVSGEGGGKTEDCERANDIYYYLRDRGYRPFFSEREMSTRAGADYEALILYALCSARCMIVVCSHEEYLHTPWVKNEYVRYGELIRADEKAGDSITVVYAGAPIQRLPGREVKIQGIDARAMDAMSRVEQFVTRHVRGAVTAPASRESAATEAKPGIKQSLSQALGSVRDAVTDGVKEAGAKATAAIRNIFGGAPHMPPPPVLPAEFEGKGTVITGYKGLSDDVRIPDFVTELAYGSFENRTDIKTVTMPKKLKKFVRKAFGKNRKKIIFTFVK